ncbi:phage holin, LLH family [Alicyclobacillus pomorum]|uniref:phage holin, LLH family n=1 Tax=Alicyclobacillus pomorum TaxID=204470 RepID=UPI0004223C45|nr:phage holin, LLH family [Alicyclobacillus pomorum]
MQDVWMTVLHQVVLLLLQLVVFTLLLLAHRLLPLVRTWMQHHLTQRERQILAFIGREAYTFAEASLAGKSGGEKLEQAMTYASQVLDRTGTSFSSDEIRAAIEAAVQEAHAERPAALKKQP